MKLIVREDYEELSRQAARFVARQLLRKPQSVLALPTGDTPIGIYRELVRLYREGLLDFSQATAFNLDEFLGIPADHPQTYVFSVSWDYCAK
jgi:glucosamine-6-phosphate deaminase